MCAGRTWTPRPPRREKADELRGRRALCEFTARAGDLDLRFTPAPTGQEGVAGHGVVTAGAAPAMKPRLPCPANTANCWCAAAPTVTTRRQAPGRDQDLSRTPGQRAREPPRRALGAGQVYGHLLCQARGLPGLTVALVYFNVATEEETMLAETHPAAELEAFFNAHCERYLAWARQEQAHRRARRGAGGIALSARIPRRPARAGGGRLPQARDGGCLLAQAPTGIGKTLGTLFPLLGRARGRPGQVLPGRQGRAGRWRCRRWTR